MKTLIKALLLVVIATAVNNRAAAAKGDFDYVTVAGPDWFGDIELRGSDIPESLTHGGFFDPQETASPPANLGRGYLITRGYDNGETRRMFDRFMYFPGSPGYVYYLEIVDGSGPYDGRWFQVDGVHGKELLTVLESKDVYSPTEPVPSAEAATAPAPDGNLYALSLAAAALAGLASGWGLRVLRDRAQLARVT